MLKIIKHYLERDGAKWSDTQILIEGLKVQYEEILKSENKRFKRFTAEGIDQYIDADENEKERLMEVFFDICYLLEVANYSDIELLSDSFRRFIDMSLGQSDIFDTERDEEEIVYSKNEVCCRIYDSLIEKRLNRECAINDRTLSDNEIREKRRRIISEIDSNIETLQKIYCKSYLPYK